MSNGIKIMAIYIYTGTRVCFILRAFAVREEIGFFVSGESRASRILNSQLSYINELLRHREKRQQYVAEHVGIDQPPKNKIK
jgi:hypothetical protein